MKPMSLRLRLAAVSALSIIVVLVLAWLGLAFLFERHVLRRANAELDTYVRQLTASVAAGADGTLSLARPLADPRFSEPLSGLFWQIEEDKSGLKLRSRSLWEQTIALPPDTLPTGGVHRHELPGPGKTSLLVSERLVIYAEGGAERRLRIAAALDRKTIADVVRDFAFDAARALAGLALILVIASWTQISFGLRPLEALRRKVAAVRSGSVKRIEIDEPVEMMPLVQEVNSLLADRERMVIAAKARVADLAHGLKTPLTVLAGDAERLRKKGEAEIAAELDELARSMHRHIQHGLSRARLQGAGRVPPSPLFLCPLVQQLVGILRRSSKGERLEWRIDMPDGLTIAMTQDDLLEMLGAILENATTWASQRVSISAEQNAGTRIIIEDDGPGVSPEDLPRLGTRGLRLDETSEGTGLGLAIAREIVLTYRGALTLESSKPHGLRAIIDIAPCRELEACEQ